MKERRRRRWRKRSERKDGRKREVKVEERITCFIHGWAPVVGHS